MTPIVSPTLRSVSMKREVQFLVSPFIIVSASGAWRMDGLLSQSAIEDPSIVQIEPLHGP